MALTDLTRISTSGIATGSTIDAPILRKDVSFRGSQVGVTSALFDSSDDALEFNDDVKLTFGNDGDLSIKHNAGAHSEIKHTGSTDFLIGAEDLILRNSALNSNKIRCNGGEVTLFHDGLARFLTTSKGVLIGPGSNTQITGTGVTLETNGQASFVGIVTAAEFSGPTYNTSGISTFYDLRVSNNLTVEGTTTTLDTNLIGVDRVEVGADSNTIVGVAITQSGTADIVNLLDGTTEVLTVTDGGKVGIGTITPATILDLQGDITIRNGAEQNAIRTSSDGKLQFLRNGAVNNLVTLTIDDTDGKVAIGTDSANARLRVHNDSDDSAIIWVSGEDVTTEYLSLGIQSGKAILRGGGTGGTSTAVVFEHSNAGTEAEGMRLHSDGNVGIGTAIPGEKLSVEDSSPAVLINATSGSGESKLQFGRTGNTNVGEIKYEHSNNALTFRTNDGADRLRITSDGKVCIAHDSALHSGTLQVSATGADAIDINSYSTNANSGGRLSFYRSKNSSIGSNTIVADDDSLGRIDFRGYNTNGNSYDQGATIEARVDGSVNSSTDMPTAILFKTSGDGSASPDERLRIGSNGSVGIGTDYLSGNNSVYHKLMVEGDTTSQIAVAKIVRKNSSASNSTYTFEIDSSAHTSNMANGGAMSVDVNSGRAFTIDGNGNVGINTSTALPTWSKFSIDHGVYGLTRFSNHSHLILQNKNSDTNNYWSLAPRDNGSITIARGPLDVNGTIPAINATFAILQTGNVGIGSDAGACSSFFEASSTTGALAYPFETANNSIQSYDPYHHEVTIKNNTNGEGNNFCGIYFRPGAHSDGNRISAARISAIDVGDYRADLTFGTRGYRGGNIRFQEVLRLDHDGHASLKTGNLSFANGQGIDFSATGNSSGSGHDELLDDYESGAWSPVITGSSSSPTFTYSTGFPRGRYIKVGNQVTVWYDIAWSGISGGGGNMKMTNLPFATGSWGYHGYGIMVHTVGTNANGATTGKHTHYANASSDFFYTLTAASTNGHMQISALGSSGHIFGGFTYSTLNT